MSWLDNYSTTNTFRSMYINGFIDISGGRLQTRSVTDGHLLIAGDSSLNNLEVHGDVSLNGNLYVGGDISWNPNSLANDSIPSSAIIGGVVGATGPAGANQSARKFITIVAPSNSSHTSSSSGFLEYIIFNIFNAASSDAKPMLYSNMSDVEYRIFYAASTIPHHSRKMAFRVTPGLWKCTVSTTTGNSMEAGIWWLDHNRNAILNTTGTEPHGGYNWGTNQDVFIYVEGDDYSSTDALIVFEMDDDYVNTAYHAPVFHLEQIFEHTSLTGDDATNDNFGITSGISSWSQPSYNANDPNRTLQITLANSSTEVASFHSDADLSLNKRLFVGEDVSLNGNLYVGGDISWNPNNLANDSIPSSAIIGGASVWTTNNSNIYFSGGNVGIGTTSPRGLFEVANTHGTGHNGSDAIYFRTSGDYFGWRYYSRWNRSWDFMFQRQNDVFYVYFANSTSRGGYFDPNQYVGQFTFTGQHRNFVENIPSTEAEDYKGLIVSANKNSYYDIDYSIKTGSDAIKINDALPYVSLCKKEKDKSCYGVISNGEDGEVREYSTGTFVSVKEKQYGDNRMFINSVGEGAIWVSNKNSNLESGDYITTSSIPGYGQKQDSDSLKNYTVAKITMDCDFQPDYIYKKKVTTRNVDITGPDASGNYYDVLNNEHLYTIDLSNEIVDNNNKKYILTFDSANNLIGATQNILDAEGQIQWEDTTEQEYAYNIRHVDPSGNIITKEQHDSMIVNNQEAYIAAFVGCTYHCG